jgi:hypothetical protein
MFSKGTGEKEGRNFDISARSGGTAGVSPQIFRPSLHSRELRRWSFRETGLAIARQLLGPDATLDADNAVYKPARVGGPTAWHQDEAYNDPNFYQRQLTIWIALFDTTLENGAMAFVPGSHLRGILPHRLHGGSEEAAAIECCEGFDPSTATICPIQAGSMTIHHGRVVHGASGNTSEGPRLGYILNYKAPPERRPELGSFPWNTTVARAIHAKRKAWLRRGGIFIELLRLIGADRDNQRYFFGQLRKRFYRKG